MKCLVTGGAGFIGSHLIEALVSQGKQVRLLDNFSSGRRANLEQVAGRIDLVEGDIRDFDTVRQAAEGCDLIFHQAALVSVPRSVEEPLLNHAVNVSGALHVFEAARQAGVRRVVYASSAAVYGDNPDLPLPETAVPRPLSPYGGAKLMNEQMAAVYQESYGLSTVGLRYFNVFGPRQDPSSPYSGVLSIFIRRLLEGGGVTIYGDGRQTRDFIHVADVVRANLAAADGDLPSGAAVFNVGRGEETSLLQVVELLQAISGRPLPVTHVPPRPGDLRHSRADITRLREALHITPQIPLAEGLRTILLSAEC